MKDTTPVIFKKTTGLFTKKTLYGVMAKDRSFEYLPAKYVKILTFKDRFFAYDGAEWHLYDSARLISNTEPLRSEPFVEIIDFGEGYIAASRSPAPWLANQWYLYDKDWNQLVLSALDADDPSGRDLLAYCSGFVGVHSFIDGRAAVMTQDLQWYLINSDGCILLSLGERMPLMLGGGFIGQHGYQDGCEVFAVYDANGHRIMLIPDPWRVMPCSGFPGRSAPPENPASNFYCCIPSLACPLTLEDGFFTLGDFRLSGKDAAAKFDRYLNWFRSCPGVEFLRTEDMQAAEGSGMAMSRCTHVFSMPGNEQNLLYLSVGVFSDCILFSFRVHAAPGAVMPSVMQGEPKQHLFLDRERIGELNRLEDVLWHKVSRPGDDDDDDDDDEFDWLDDDDDDDDDDS